MTTEIPLGILHRISSDNVKWVTGLVARNDELETAFAVQAAVLEDKTAEVDQKDTLIRDLKRQLSEAEATRDALATVLVCSGSCLGIKDGWHHIDCRAREVSSPKADCTPICIWSRNALRRAKSL